MSEETKPPEDQIPQPIECRAAVAIESIDNNEIVFLPAGIHGINPMSGGIGKTITVLIDAQSATAVEQQRGEITSRTGKRVYFDFNHEDGPASFWPQSFAWNPEKGVIAKGEWSASGKRAVEGKDFRTFSPVFHVDDKHKDPSRVICCERARPNMGGLVNDPAFSNLSLWAKNAGNNAGTALEHPAITTTKTGEVTMTPEEIAALQAKKEELEAKVESLTALVSKNDEDENAKATLEMLKAQAEAADASLKSAALKAQNELQAKEIERRNRVEAEAAVKKAVERGAILPKNVGLQKELITQATADPKTFLPIIIGMQGRGGEFGQRITPSYVPSGSGFGQISIVNEDPVAVYAKMHQLLQDSARTGDHEDKVRLGQDFAAIFAGSMAETDKNRDQRSRLMGVSLKRVKENLQAIMAADVTDANLGTIAGTLVTQRTLELLKAVFPALNRFTTDFSDQPATFNQTVMTRIVTVPTVVTYSTATGWADAAAQTTDVPIVINNHKGIPITFNENLLASTMRQLFNEFAEASAYALAKVLVDALYANLTDANFTNNSVFASTAFNRAAVVDVGTALTTRGVPLGTGNRTLILWPAAFGNLEKDSAMQFFQGAAAPQIVTEGITPESAFTIRLESFLIYSAPNLPSNNANLVGFAGSKSALCIATRTPNDYTAILPGASFGNVQMVSDPDIGMTVMQVQYVNHTLGTATSRIALMYGTAPGQTVAGQLIKAAAGTGTAR